MQLLGRKDSLLLGLIARVNSVDVSVTTEQIKHYYADVIGQDIGCLPGEYEIRLTVQWHQLSTHQELFLLQSANK